MKTGNSFSLLLGAALIGLGQLHAEPSVVAKVSATEVNLNGAITLSIEIAEIGNVGPAPNFNIPDFQVQRAGQTSSYQWINGQSSSLTTFNYLLMPTKTGTLQIPSVTLSADGKNYNTQPISITVTNENASTTATPASVGELPNKTVAVPTEGLKPVFVTASVDVNKAYVGQQIILRVQFLRRPDFRLAAQPRYVEPDMTGFLVEPLKQQEYTTTLNGTQYAVTELAYALFPTSDGEFTIGAAQIDLAVRRQADPFDPDGFFQSFFGRTETARLATRAIPIQVRALPKNKPATFSGSVGRFKINAKMDTDAPEAGKPFNLVVTVEGVGNINAIKEPFLPNIPGFRKYETISNSNPIKDGKFLHGSKEFKILLIPQVSGPLTIPAMAFSFFNPAQNEFKTETTAPILIQVKPGTINPNEPDVVPPLVSQGETSEIIRVVEKDIRFIKTGSVHKIIKSTLFQTWYHLMLVFPPLFAFVAYGAAFQTRKKREQPSLYRSRRALSRARAHLKIAAKKSVTQDAPTFYGHIYSVVAGFLADKFGVASAGLKWEEIENRLKEINIEPTMITQIREILDEADMARFATSSFMDQDRKSIINKTEALLLVLNKTL